MAWNYFLDRRRSFYAIAQTSRTDVRSFYYRSVSLRLGRLTGCLYLFIPRQGLRQRPDRQHRADGRQAVCGRVGRGTALPDAPLRLCAGHFCGRVHPPQAQADAVAPLASAGGAVRDPAALRRGLFATGAKSASQLPRLLLLRHAGTILPQGERLCLRQHHVHRQSAQRHGFPLRMAGGRQHQSLRQGDALLRHHLPVRAGCRPRQPCTGPHGQPGHLAFLSAALHQLLPDVPEGGH